MPPQFQPLQLCIKQSDRVRLSVYNAKPVIIWSRGSRNSKEAPCFIATHYSKEIHFMLVYILNHNGEPLMPCKPQKVRKLLNEKKAKVKKDIIRLKARSTTLIQQQKGEAIPPAFEKAGVLA